MTFWYVLLFNISRNEISWSQINVETILIHDHLQDVPAGAPKMKVYSREDIEHNPKIAYNGGRNPRDLDDDDEDEEEVLVHIRNKNLQ